LVGVDVVIDGVVASQMVRFPTVLERRPMRDRNVLSDRLGAIRVLWFQQADLDLKMVADLTLLAKFRSRLTANLPRRFFEAHRGPRPSENAKGGIWPSLTVVTPRGWRDNRKTIQSWCPRKPR
jgi:hypothetical protein